MADEKTQADASTQQDGGQQSEQTQAQPTQEKTFTQAELERIIAERLGRVKSQYADYDTLKAKAEQLEAANKSETEKAIERATKAEAALAAEKKAAARATLIADAKVAAIGLKFKADKVEKVLRMIDITDDSTSDSVRTALEALAKEMPELLDTPKPAGVYTGAANPARGETQDAETREQRLARLRGGGTQFNDWLSGASVVLPPDQR